VHLKLVWSDDPKGFTHGLKSPPACKMWAKILRFASLDKAQALIIKSVKRRDKTCQGQAGRPLTVKPQTNATTTDTRRASGMSRRRAVPSSKNPTPVRPAPLCILSSSTSCGSYLNRRSGVQAKHQPQHRPARAINRGSSITYNTHQGVLTHLTF
jgi:hypothetical protein